MPEILPSYLAGPWVTGAGQGDPVVDAVDGKVITHVTTEGLDFAEAVTHAKAVGGPALRDLGFTARADILKAAAVALAERKQGSTTCP
jgi:oxepin-CoA hydrolase/3-oxo-5,6-dehydrosuberyl-CoA semialdehyde dehydrogenase